MHSNVHYWDLQLAPPAPIRLGSTLSLNDSIPVLSLGLFPLSLGMPSTLPSVYSEPHCLPRPLPSLKTVLWVHADLFLMWPLRYLPSVLGLALMLCEIVRSLKIKPMAPKYTHTHTPHWDPWRQQHKPYTYTVFWVLLRRGCPVTAVWLARPQLISHFTL